MSCDQVATTPPALPTSPSDAPFRRPWTADEDHLLVDHRKQVMTNQDWIDLKPLFNGRSAAALKQRSNMIRRGEVHLGGSRPKLGKPVKMPEAIVAEVIRLRDGGMDFAAIGARVGFAGSYCRYKYYDCNKTHGARPRIEVLWINHAAAVALDREHGGSTTPLFARGDQ
jgi:hypothetical protein